VESCHDEHPLSETSLIFRSAEDDLAHNGLDTGRAAADPYTGYAVVWPRKGTHPVARRRLALSPERMEERAWAVQKEILPEATFPDVVIERARGYNPDGSWRGLWKARVSDQRDGILFAAVWEDATGELVQFSRSIADQPHSDSPDAAIRSEAMAVEAAKSWLKRLSPVPHRQWQMATEVMRLKENWTVSLACPDGRMLIHMEAATNKPTYLLFRPKRAGK
jgi:hypothetical protein